MKVETRKIVLSGLLIALSIVLTRIFAPPDLLIAGMPANRLSAGYVPILLSGMLFGPVFGFIVGGSADAIGFFMFPKGDYFFPFSLTSALVGMLPYFIIRITGKTPDWLKVLVSVVVSNILVSMFLQTFLLSYKFGMNFNILFIPRAIVALVMIPVYYLLLMPVIAALKRTRLVPPRLGGPA